MTPDGWKPFEDGIYSGSVRTDWQVGTVKPGKDGTPADVVSGSLPVQLVLSLGATGNGPIAPAFLVQMYVEPNGPTFLLSSPACISASLLPLATNDRDLADAFAYALGVDTRPAGFVSFEERRFAVAELAFDKTMDSYVALLGAKDCLIWVLFASLRGDSAAFDDFRTFVSLLQIDSSRIATK